MQADDDSNHVRIETNSQKYFGLEIEKIGSAASQKIRETMLVCKAEKGLSTVDP